MSWRDITLRAVNGIDRAVAHLCSGVILLIGSTLLAILAGNVLARYVLSSGGFDFAQELPEQLFPVFIMAGVVLGVQKGGHMAVETVLFLLNRQGARILLLLGHTIVIGSYLLLGNDILLLADMLSTDHSPVLGIPASYSYYLLAIGLGLIVVATTTLAVKVALMGPEAMPMPTPEEQVS